MVAVISLICSLHNVRLIWCVLLVHAALVLYMQAPLSMQRCSYNRVTSSSTMITRR